MEREYVASQCNDLNYFNNVYSRTLSNRDIGWTCPIRLNLPAWLINHGTVFFSHNKSASAGLSAAETIGRTS